MHDLRHTRTKILVVNVRREASFIQTIALK